jgi:putative transposase
MAKPRRLTPGGCVYHVCNRGSRRGVILETYEDYAAFCALVEEARRKRPMRILAYSLRRTHFHFLLWPVGDQDVPHFMKWLTATHAARFHRSRGTVGTGAVYQSRYVSRGIEDVRDFISVLRYVEGNALKDGVVTRAEDWPWCSAWGGEGFGATVVMDDSPIPRPSNWLQVLNEC